MKNLTINEKIQIIIKLGFLPDFTEDLIKYLTDYFDSVRGLA